MKKKLFALAAIAVMVLVLIAIIYKLPANAYTVDEVLSSPDEFENKSIEVFGNVQKTNCVSTLMECPETDQCCNSVSCTLALKGTNGFILLTRNSTVFECTGTNCEVQCSIEPGEYTLTGIFSSEYGEYFLEVEQII